MVTVSTRILFLIFFYPGLTYLVTLTFALDLYFLSRCINSTGYYTANSAYERDLSSLFNEISSTTKLNYGFFHSQSGEVNVIALCRGDVKLNVCTSCLNDTISEMKQRCPRYKEAIGWSEFCMLRYSSRNISKRVELSPQACLLNTQSAVEGNPYEILDVLKVLLDYLRSRAAAGGTLLKYATSSSSLGAQLWYALVQCTPDLSEQDCNDCLKAATDGITSCCVGQRGCRVLKPSCNLRFESYPFFDSGPAVLLPQSPSTDAAPALPPPQSPRSKKEENKQKKSVWIPLGASLSATLGLALFSACGFFIWRRRNIQEDNENSQEVQLLDLVRGSILDEHSSENFNGENVSRSQEFPSIQLNILHVATNSFCDENKLGEGGFGPVYKGTLADGKAIAVKRLSRTSGQGLLEFKNEVMLIAKLQHRNLVRLLGCCLEKNEKLLVYEFMPNRSLDVFLFDSSMAMELSWQKRFNIIKGVARGILYLHEDSRLRIIHRDLKASNVLLDHEMNPKISDFGMARIFGGDQNQANTNRVVGTYGYMAPEYAMEGLFSIKSDVFSFGVLLLEIISGKRNNGFHVSERGESLLTFAWKLWSKGQGMELMDQLLVQSCVAAEVLKCIHIGLLCVQEDPADRPSMSSVVVMLGSETITLPRPAEPAFSVGRVVAEPIEPTSNDRNCSINEVTISKLSPR
ncbi:cysteine-rich receptor-like protein kinase 10 isoform X2 [Herrania umbratica]|nr:cysteine-rich receptor-like protein kinase 10 isoform X2 [Herrania umbratica]XP_021293791.1 cysteine-rich receptor-like protein kinase 10 isoform X2 [Herrania umbratica]